MTMQQGIKAAIAAKNPSLVTDDLRLLPLPLITVPPCKTIPRVDASPDDPAWIGEYRDSQHAIALLSGTC